MKQGAISSIFAFCLASCNPISQYPKYYSGIIIEKRNIDHDEYMLLLQTSTTKQDTLVLISWKADSSKINVGDSIEKKAESYQAFLYRNANAKERPVTLTVPY